MRYYREILKKSNEKNLLVKLKAILNITKLREIVNFINRLRFKSFEIIVLKQFLKFANLPIIKKNEKSALVTESLEKIKKNRYGILYI